LARYRQYGLSAHDVGAGREHEKAASAGGGRRLLQRAGASLGGDAPSLIVEYGPTGRRLALGAQTKVHRLRHGYSTPRLRNRGRVIPLASRCSTERMLSCVVPSVTVAMSRKCSLTPSIV